MPRDFTSIWSNPCSENCFFKKRVPLGPSEFGIWADFVFYLRFLHSRSFLRLSIGMYCYSSSFQIGSNIGVFWQFWDSFQNSLSSLMSSSELSSASPFCREFENIACCDLTSFLKKNFGKILSKIAGVSKNLSNCV